MNIRKEKEKTEIKKLEGKNQKEAESLRERAVRGENKERNIFSFFVKKMSLKAIKTPLNLKLK